MSTGADTSSSEANPDTDTEPDADAETNADAEEEEQVPDLTKDAGGFSCIADADTILSFFDQFTPILDEMKVHLNPDGLEGRGVDPANVGMVDEELPEDAFEHYSSTGGLIGIDLNRVTDILGLAENGDTVSLELDQETRKLEIVIDGLEYTLALIDPNSIRQEPDIPDLDLPAKVTLEGRDISRAVTAADMVSDHIRFETGQTDDGEDAFIVSAEGDTDDVDLELTREDLIDLEMGEAESLFSLDYLKDFAKVIPDDAEVTLEIGEEFPVFIQFGHIENEENDGEFYGEVTQMLAPRIQSD